MGEYFENHKLEIPLIRKRVCVNYLLGFVLGDFFHVTECFIVNPAGIYLVRVNNRNTRQKPTNCLSVVDHLGVVLVSLLLTLNIFNTLF